MEQNKNPTPTWAVRQLSCLLQEASKGCSPFLQVLLSGSPFREAILRLLLLEQAVTKSWPFLCWFVLLVVCSAHPSVHNSAPTLSKGLFLPWLPFPQLPTQAPPAHCCAAAPGLVLHYVGICPAGFLLRKRPGFLLLLQTLIDSQTFSMKWHQWKETKVPVVSWCAWSRKVICIQMKIKINQNLFLHVQGGETSSSSGRSTLHWVLQNNVSLFYTVLFIRSYIFIF